MAKLPTDWRVSSFSKGTDCLGMRELTGELVELTNTKRPDAGRLAFDRAALAAWVADCKSGELDDLTS